MWLPAMPAQSKPGPMLAVVAGTRTVTRLSSDGLGWANAKNDRKYQNRGRWSKILWFYDFVIIGAGIYFQYGHLSLEHWISWKQESGSTRSETLPMFFQESQNPVAVGYKILQGESLPKWSHQMCTWVYPVIVFLFAFDSSRPDPRAPTFCSWLRSYQRSSSDPSWHPSAPFKDRDCWNCSFVELGPNGCHFLVFNGLIVTCQAAHPAYAFLQTWSPEATPRRGFPKLRNWVAFQIPSPTSSWTNKTNTCQQRHIDTH